MIRSNLLVHWTGKDISTRQDALTPTECDQYVDRLVSILTRGFWMTRPTDRLVGGNRRSRRGSSISYSMHPAMTCFTEVRLSNAIAHARKFGLLGIAVDRRFVLDRWGSPVHYVRNSKEENLVGKFFELRYLLQQCARSGGVSTQDALDAAEHLGLFFKPMSSPNTDDFAMIDEHEWRVVWNEEQQTRGNIAPTGAVHPEFRMPVSHSDVRLIVFPDEITRRRALADRRFIRRFPAGSSNPPLLTLQETQSL